MLPRDRATTPTQGPGLALREPAGGERSRSGVAYGRPDVRRVYPPDVLDQLARLWTRREALLAALDRLPQVLCHHDAFRRNLLLQSGMLLAVDWAFLGPGPLGAELAPLVTASAAFRAVERERWEDLKQTTSNAYLQGLRDAGWDGPPEQPRFGFAGLQRSATGPASSASYCRRCWTKRRTPVPRCSSAFRLTRSSTYGRTSPPSRRDSPTRRSGCSLASRSPLPPAASWRHRSGERSESRTRFCFARAARAQTRARRGTQSVVRRRSPGSASRTSRRRFASRWRRSSSAVSGVRDGSGTGFSSPPSATIVK